MQLAKQNNSRPTKCPQGTATQIAGICFLEKLLGSTNNMSLASLAIGRFAIVALEKAFLLLDEPLSIFQHFDRSKDGPLQLNKAGLLMDKHRFRGRSMFGKFFDHRLPLARHGFCGDLQVANLDTVRLHHRTSLRISFREIRTCHVDLLILRM
jgi:hypothetical protein